MDGTDSTLPVHGYLKRRFHTYWSEWMKVNYVPYVGHGTLPLDLYSMSCAVICQPFVTNKNLSLSELTGITCSCQVFVPFMCAIRTRCWKHIIINQCLLWWRISFNNCFLFAYVRSKIVKVFITKAKYIVQWVCSSVYNTWDIIRMGSYLETKVN
jgi:hypothetical protein